MLRWDYVAKPAFTAFANLTAQLSNARYLGTKAVGKNADCFVFEQPGGSKTLVLWSQGDAAVPVRINDSVAKVERVDFMGKRTTLHSQNGVYTLSAERYPTYIHGFREIKPFRPFVPLKQKAAFVPQKDLTIVMRLNLEKGFQIVRNKALVDKTNLGQATLDIFNFSDQAKQGKVENLGQGYTIKGLSEPINIAPMGKVTLPVELKFKED
jgi:hypothetical protein